MKSTLLRDRVSNMRVMDILNCLTHSTNPPEQLAALKAITSKDNVHLTEEGQKALAAGLLKEAESLREPKEKVQNPSFIRQRTVNWNGLVSPQGIGKSSLKAAKNQPLPPNPTPTLGKANRLLLLFLSLSS
jgi:hypothetical protein